MILDSIPPWIIAFGVAFGILRQWRQERAVARTLASTTAEAKRAADAARLAASLVAEKGKEHAAALAGMAENLGDMAVDLHKVELQGNSNATRLEEAARAQGHLAGVTETEAKISSEKDNK